MKNKPTVLLVDDEDMLRRVGTRILNHAGYNVVTAEDGEDGIRKFLDGGIDVVISDVTMPNMRGPAMAAEVRKINLTVPIYLVSSSNGAPDALAALKDGIVQGVLDKPYTPQDLKALVAKHYPLQ